MSHKIYAFTLQSIQISAFQHRIGTFSFTEDMCECFKSCIPLLLKATILGYTTVWEVPKFKMVDDFELLYR